MRRALERGYQRFYAAYREAAEQLRAGVTDVEFPHGSFPPPEQFVRPLVRTGYG